MSPAPVRVDRPAGACMLAAAAAVLALAGPARAVPLVPADDDEVVQRLTTPRTAAARAADPRQALEAARTLLAQARREGDPRGAGQALALLRPLASGTAAPAEAVVLAAEVEQHLHQFDTASARLRTLLARDDRVAPAWLMLATISRVQGRLDEADAACRALQRLRQTALGLACTAENEGLRGRHEAARATLALLRGRADDPVFGAWLDVTAGELEARAGRMSEAERRLRAALDGPARREADIAGGSYAALALADLLLDEGRGAEARQVLADRPPTDAVLLRRARAGDAASADELRARYAQADERPGAAAAHARERAMFALDVEQDAPRAVALAREGLKTQRESADLLLLARAGRAAGDAQAQDEARRIAAGMDLHDERLHPAAVAAR